MKTKSIFKALAVVMLSCFTFMSASAQPGNFFVQNNSAVSVTVQAFADIDQCVGTFFCATAPVVIPAGGNFTFTGCTFGAWKGFRVTDGCGGTTVGICPTTLPTTSTFTGCFGLLTANYVDEHNGTVN